MIVAMFASSLLLVPLVSNANVVRYVVPSSSKSERATTPSPGQPETPTKQNVTSSAQTKKLPQQTLRARKRDRLYEKIEDTEEIEQHTSLKREKLKQKLHEHRDDIKDMEKNVAKHVLSYINNEIFSAESFKPRLSDFEILWFFIYCLVWFVVVIFFIVYIFKAVIFILTRLFKAVIFILKVIFSKDNRN